MEELGIYTNFNMIPFDTKTPFNPSGIRMGTPALTTRGFRESEMEVIGEMIAKALKNVKAGNAETNNRIKQQISELCRRFPLYPGLEY
jgi:glycine hydroxymethyltransferase